jgi:hypothetical protein
MLFETRFGSQFATRRVVVCVALPHASSGADMSDTEGAWLVIGVGVLAILCALYDLHRGRTRASYRDRCGWIHTVDIDGERNPIQYLARVMITVLIGVGLITYGIRKLLGW